MQSLPKGECTRRGDWEINYKLIYITYCLEMNEIVDEMVAAVDDGDGVIDYEEFVKMIQKY